MSWWSNCYKAYIYTLKCQMCFFSYNFCRLFSSLARAQTTGHFYLLIWSSSSSSSWSTTQVNQKVSHSQQSVRLFLSKVVSCECACYVFQEKMGEVSLSLLQLYQTQQKQQQLKLNFSFVKNQIVGMKFKCGAIFC